MQVQKLTFSSSIFCPRRLSTSSFPAHQLTTELSMSHSGSTSGFCSFLKWESKSTTYLGKPRRLVGIRCGRLNEEGNDDDGFYMRRCVELARRAIGCTSPNPMVGCVIVKDGKVVGEGFHPKAGQPHAEVNFILIYFSAVCLHLNPLRFVYLLKNLELMKVIGFYYMLADNRSNLIS